MLERRLEFGERSHGYMPEGVQRVMLGKDQYCDQQLQPSDLERYWRHRVDIL